MGFGSSSAKHPKTPNIDPSLKKSPFQGINTPPSTQRGGLPPPPLTGRPSAIARIPITDPVQPSGGGIVDSSQPSVQGIINITMPGQEYGEGVTSTSLSSTSLSTTSAMHPPDIRSPIQTRSGTIKKKNLDEEQKKWLGVLQTKNLPRDQLQEIENRIKSESMSTWTFSQKEKWGHQIRRELAKYPNKNNTAAFKR